MLSRGSTTEQHYHRVVSISWDMGTEIIWSRSAQLLITGILDAGHMLANRSRQYQSLGWYPISVKTTSYFVRGQWISFVVCLSDFPWETRTSPLEISSSSAFFGCWLPVNSIVGVSLKRALPQITACAVSLSVQKQKYIHAWTVSHVLCATSTALTCMCVHGTFLLGQHSSQYAHSFYNIK